MICSKCGRECYAKVDANKLGDMMVGDCKAVSICCNAEIIEELTSMSEWKDLHISNIPSDFRDNDNYMLRVQNLSGYWVKEDVSDKEDRILILHHIVDDNFRYRYKLKPLDSIRLTREIWKIYCNHREKNVAFIEIDGRKVELID